MSANNPGFNEEHQPRAYLITFRCYGTWLHGDERGSMDRHNHRYGAPLIPSEAVWEGYDLWLLKYPPVKLTGEQRLAVEQGIRKGCERRAWFLYAVNVRTNHVHSVVGAACKPETIWSALKAYSTRAMRQRDCWPHSHSPWSDKGSGRYLWTEKHLERAIDYVVNGQGEDLRAFDQETDER